MYLNNKQPSKHLVCGDFNIKILTNYEDSKRLTLLNEKISTRITNNSTSCIDLVFAIFKTELKVEELKTSGHSALFIELDFLSCKNSSNNKTEMRT